MVAGLFLVSLAALPVVGVLGEAPIVTAPALVVVGFLMTGPLARIDWRDPGKGLPAFLTVVLMPLTYNISTGLAAGFVSYSLLSVIRGRAREVHWLVHAIAGSIVVGYAVVKLVA